MMREDHFEATGKNQRRNGSLLKLTTFFLFGCKKRIFPYRVSERRYE